MGFLDNFSKKVSDIGQKAIQKTGELSEIARINSQISTNEEKINNTYFQIGKLFVSTYGENCSGEFSDMISAITDLEKQNEDLKKKIQKIRKIQHCTNCGAEVPEGVAFCSICGTKIVNLAAGEGSDSVKCPKCGAMLRAGLRFCTSCGQAVPSVEKTDVDSSQIAAENRSDSEVVLSEEKPEEEKEASMGVCPKCGAPVGEDNEFCMECGEKLKE